MSGYEHSSLWQSSFGNQSPADGYEEFREFFRLNYESFRVNAGLLAGEIARDLPEYTVHDITHIDALWELGSLICGEGYELNPAEAFVLGGAFLIHDLGMGLAAYPEGIHELTNTTIWADTFARISKERRNASTEEIRKHATHIVLRALHAKHAERLALISWGAENEKLYLINSPELRSAYGTIIGLIAHSHWWNSNELATRLPNSLGALETMPNAWGIDPVKIACILRVSDASHIDARRAPLMLKAFRKLSQYSEQHWTFQERLYQPRLKSERLVYTSKSSFSTGEFNSWWLCYDTLKMIDTELRNADTILGESNRQRFNARGVAGANNVTRLSQLITTDGWQPIDTQVRVGNVARLVRNLGGEQLYGRNLVVPLREMIQNSCDAIRARRVLESESDTWGEVCVKKGEDDDGIYIEVKDNGVGMSDAVLSGPFLDFGTSFWGTSMMHNEFPGLESKGFSSTGKFGIGFFSTFMWGEKIKVISRRYEESRQNTRVLEFQNGLMERPLLRKAGQTEQIRDGGTTIRVYFSKSENYSNLFETHSDSPLTIHDLVEELCPAMDVTITTESDCGDTFRKSIIANDWQTLSSAAFIKRALGNIQFEKLSGAVQERLVALSANIRSIESDGKVVARGFLSSIHRSSRITAGQSIEGTVVVGGFRTCDLTKIVGIFVGETSRASRDIGVPLAEGENLQNWASDQAKLLYENFKIKEDEALECSEYIRAMGGDVGSLPIAIHSTGVINIVQFRNLVEDNLQEIVLVSSAGFSLLERQKGQIKLAKNVFVVDPGIPGILQTGNSDVWISWPRGSDFRFDNYTLKGLLLHTFAQVWQLPLETVRKSSELSSDKKSYSSFIGVANGKKVVCDHIDIIKI